VPVKVRSVDRSGKVTHRNESVYFYLFPAFRGGIGNVKSRKFGPNYRPKNQAQTVLSHGEFRFSVFFL